MKLFIKKIEGITLPSKANALDAGYDIVATSGPNIIADKEDMINPAGILDDTPTLYRRIAYIEYDTNLYWTPKTEFIKQVENAHADASGALCGLVFKEETQTYHIELFPRSSISKYNLVLANSVGTVDTGYRNQVKARFKYIWQPQDLRPYRNSNNDYELMGNPNQKYLYQKGDKIMQMKPRLNENIEITLVDELPEMDTRGLGGFGSSGV